MMFEAYRAARPGTEELAFRARLSLCKDKEKMLVELIDRFENSPPSGVGARAPETDW